MDKYISIYTQEQFLQALDLLENTWTQIELINGQPGQVVHVFFGDSTAVNNLVTPSSVWQVENSEAGLTDTTYMTYPEYNKFWVRSSYNGTPQLNSKYKLSVDVVSGHKYYLYAVADGIIANENPNSNSYNSDFNRYGISLESSDGLTVVASMFAKDVDVHELSCIGTIPDIESPDFVVSLYSNKDTVAKDAIVYFGCVTLVDLTECFGEGKEPSIDWCNQYLKFYTGTSTKTVIVTNIEGTDSYLSNVFDENGTCIISTPGFGIYSVVVTDNQDIVYYNNMVVNRIKRYTIDLASS